MKYDFKEARFHKVNDAEIIKRIEEKAVELFGTSKGNFTDAVRVLIMEGKNGNISKNDN